MKLFCITLTLPIFSFAQVTVPTSGQCQAFCLKEYALFKEFILLNGNSYQDVEVSNNTDFSLCKLGCHSPGFNDLTLPAFKKGQLAYENIIEHSSNAPLTQSPVRSVSLLCFDSFLNGTMFGRLLFELEKRAASQFYVHYVEGVQLIHAETLMERVFWQAWSYASSIDFTTMLKLSNSSIQFRVTSFTVEGIVGIMAKSQWYEEPHFKNSFSRSIGIVVKHQAWRDDLASTELAFITSPDHVPTCSLVLAYHSHSGQEQRIEFIMDRSRGYLMERLAFARNYSVRLTQSTASGKGSHLEHSSLRFMIPSCISLVQDSSMCAPPPVSSIEWKWNASHIDGHVLYISWTYARATQLVNEDRGQSTKRDSSSLQMVHFDITINPLVTTSQYQCQNLDSQRRVVTWTHRSVVVYVPDDHCNYEVEITVVDAKNRRSSTKKSQIIRFEEKKYMLLTAERWSSGMVLLSVVLFLAIVAVAAGMAVCRVKDRRDFNTLKRSISPGLRTGPQLASKLMFGRYEADPPCAKRVVGRRPISYNESEKSAQISITPTTLGPSFGHDIYTHYNDSTQENSRHSGIYPRPPTIALPHPTMKEVRNLSAAPSSLKKLWSPITSNSTRSLTDEETYDALETPRRSKASPYPYCAGDVLKCIPFDSLEHLNEKTTSVSILDLRLTVLPSLSQSDIWRYAHVFGPDNTAYGMKYTGSKVHARHLKRELQLATCISLQHHNLVNLLGVGINDNWKVLSLLYEPCRGGKLSDFLRTSLTFLNKKCLQSAPLSDSSGSSSTVGSLKRSLLGQMDLFAVYLHRFAQQVASGLAFLHDQGCMHTHVSVDNVYLILEYNIEHPLEIPCDQFVKLGDYCFNPGWTEKPNLQTDNISIPPKMGPPESFGADGTFLIEGDVWQFGLLVCDIVSFASTPSLYSTACDGRITVKVVENYLSQLSAGVDTIDSLLLALKTSIMCCLEIKPNRRPTMKLLAKRLQDKITVIESSVVMRYKCMESALV